MATILVVDDLAANREVLVSLLRYKGHRLLEAEDGSQGLAAALAERPDLVITDVLMPVMDGYEFVRQLRADPATRGIRVVFYTAHYGEREARALAFSSGVADVLTKPVEPEDVLRVVDRVLSGESPAAAAPASQPLTPDFDRQHLRLVTDQLSAKARDLSAANARLRALINIGLELASEQDADRLLQTSARPPAICLVRPTSRWAFSIARTARSAGSSPKEAPRPVGNAWASKPLGSSAPSSPNDARCDGTTSAATRQRWVFRQAIPRFVRSWRSRSPRRRTSTAGSASSATKAGRSRRTMSRWSWRCRDKSAAFTRTATSMRWRGRSAIGPSATWTRRRSFCSRSIWRGASRR